MAKGSRGQRQAIPAPGGDDALERRRADWERTAADLRELLREGHELVRSLRQASAEAALLLAACDPERLGPLVDERIAAAVADGLDRYEARVGEQISEACGRVFARFDELTAALLGDGEDDEAALRASLSRYMDRQRVLAAAAGRQPRETRNVMLGPGDAL